MRTPKILLIASRVEVKQNKNTVRCKYSSAVHKVGSWNPVDVPEFVSSGTGLIYFGFRPNFEINSLGFRFCKVEKIFDFWHVAI